MGNLGKRALSGCMAFALAAVVAIALFVAFEFGHLPKKTFNAAKWREAHASINPPARLHMVDSLMRSRRLDNLTRPQVQELLGPPNENTSWSDEGLVYWLGPNRGFLRIDSDWFVIRFGPNGRVSDYEITSD